MGAIDEAVVAVGLGDVSAAVADVSGTVGEGALGDDGAVAAGNGLGVALAAGGGAGSGSRR